jgi:Mycothiol maleylpyruvate isomerase N-terminal domain
MEIAEHLEALRGQGELMTRAAERAGLATAVPSCPPWQVKDLLRHTGYIHRWAARHITECPRQVIDGPSEAEILRGGAADEDLLDELITGFGQRRKYQPHASPSRSVRAACSRTARPGPAPLRRTSPSPGTPSR